MNMDMFDEFVKLDKKKKQLKEEIKTIQGEINKLEPIILNDMDEEGLTNLKKHGKTVYINERISGSPINGDREASVRWLGDNGHGHIVEENYNGIRLNSLLAELNKQEGGIPEEFDEAFTIHRIYSLRVRGNK